MYRLGAGIFESLIYSDQGAQFQKFTLSTGLLKSKFHLVTFLPVLVVYHHVKYYGSPSRIVGEIAFCACPVLIWAKIQLFAYLTLTLTFKVKGHILSS